MRAQAFGFGLEDYLEDLAPYNQLERIFREQGTIEVTTRFNV